jgi:uncharacterized protein
VKMGDISNEPTMEDILSSIKKIISDDSAKALSAPRVRRTPPRDEADSIVPTAQAQHEPLAEDDVLELTETAGETAMSAEPLELVSPIAANASRSALDQLSALVVKPEVTGSDTLEGMVRDMLRPMLKDWLDANLPRVVEAMVSKEISRISGK